MGFKITVVGGGGVRTPLLIHGLAESGLDIGEVVLYDPDYPRAQTMASLGQLLAPFPVVPSRELEPAVEGASFVLSSIRVGGIEARARDERIAIDHGFAGQETTGPGGAAMALRTVPVVLNQVRISEKLAPDAWYISFTNPAGLITQAIANHSTIRAIGICDTPSELIEHIAKAMGGPVECDYAGLNHLGWVRRVLRDGVDVTEHLLNDEKLLRSLYSAELFDPALIRTLGLIPTEYLFFYYSQTRALTNQQRAGATRGAEIQILNRDLFRSLASGTPEEGLETYRRYLMQRNASYMKLEAESGSAFRDHGEQPNPFSAATGYHRVAVEVLQGLNSDQPRPVILNVPNQGSITDLQFDDVVEVPCDLSRAGPVPRSVGRLPDAVRGLVMSVKWFERTLIDAAIQKSLPLAQLALLGNPIISEWEPAGKLLSALVEVDPDLSYLTESRYSIR